MKRTRLIYLIATVFSLLVSFPRVLFLMRGDEDAVVNQIIEVTAFDTGFRILLLFGFTFVVLKFNLEWNTKIAERKRLWASVLVNLGILAVWLVLFQLIHVFVYDFYATVFGPFVNGMTYFFFLLLLVLLSKAVVLVDKSKVDALERERLKRKSLQNELDALKNQINPHFLFNSLNTLSFLVREDQKAAEKFIQKLAFLFRYMLQSKGQDVVEVSEELKVLESYIHLIQHRYRENFSVQINIDDDTLTSKVPILAMQMLMENAIKHNEISDKKPLHIEIFGSNREIVFRNGLQKRVGSVEGTNTGLTNLNTRVKLLMGKEVRISKTDKHFTVYLPTL